MEEKKEIFNKLFSSIVTKIAQVKESLAFAKESRDNDTKSSAGDKYETGREMMQIEINKSEDQLNKFRSLKNDLSKINLQRKFDSIEFGSLVETNMGVYFISIAHAKIQINNKEYYTISLASPIGKLFHQKKEGDAFELNGRKFIINKIT